VFFWHNDEFIGWDSVYESISPSISAYGPGYFEISYPHYANGDPLANPSLPNVKVIYQWNNKNFTAQGSPPQDNFGKTAQPIRVKYLN